MFTPEPYQSFGKRLRIVRCIVQRLGVDLSISAPHTSCQRANSFALLHVRDPDVFTVIPQDTKQNTLSLFSRVGEIQLNSR